MSERVPELNELHWDFPLSVGLGQLTKEIEEFLRKRPKIAADVTLTLFGRTPSLAHFPFDASNVQLPMALAGLIIGADDREKHIYSGATVAIVARR